MNSPVSWIWLRHLTLPFARVGVHPHEQDVLQTLRLEVGLRLDVTAAAHSDAVDETLDWSAIEAHVVAHVRRQHYKLIETLAYRLAESLLQAFARATCVELEIEKIGCLKYGSGAVRVQLGRGSPQL